VVFGKAIGRQYCHSFVCQQCIEGQRHRFDIIKTLFLCAKCMKWLIVFNIEKAHDFLSYKKQFPFLPGIYTYMN